MRRLVRQLATVTFVMLVIPVTQARAQSVPTAAGLAKVNKLFSDKAFGNSKCEALIKDNAPVYECTYRGKGLQVVSTRGLTVREDDIDDDVFMVVSNAAALDVFPNTPEFLQKLLRFNLTMDFCKISLSRDSTVLISSLMKVSQINTPSDLSFMFDQVAACVGEFATRFGQDTK